MKYPLILSLFLLCASMCSANAEVSVIDDFGNKIVLSKSAERIISLAPHITELLFSVGAGEHIVGVVNYSDYPLAAKQITKVGSYNQINIELIIGLKPDLIIGWNSGNPQHIIEKLKELGFVVFLTESRNLSEIPNILKRFSMMVGTKADKVIAAYNVRLKKLKEKYAKKKQLKLFYQYWNNPLMTINGEHMISDVIRVCGAKNIFNDLNILAPAVSVEAVVTSDVDVIIVGGLLKQHQQWLDDWTKWKDLPAVKNNNLFKVNPDLLQRNTVRLLDGAQELCEKIDLAR